MLKDRFAELERRIRTAAEFLNRLKQENLALEMKYVEAQKQVAEMTDEMDQHRREQEEFANRVEDLLDHFKELPEDLEKSYRNGLTVVDGFEGGDELDRDFPSEAEGAPDDYLAQFKFGKSYEKKGLWEKAIEAYQQAIDIKPDFIDAIEHLAFLLEKLNREKEASPLWERVITLKK